MVTNRVPSKCCPLLTNIADDQSFGVEAHGNAPGEDGSGTLSAADLSKNNPNNDVYLVQTDSDSLEQLTSMLMSSCPPKLILIFCRWPVHS